MKEKEAAADKELVCIARIKPDKAFSAFCMRSLFLHADKREEKEVIYYPEQIFESEIEGSKIFFVPVVNRATLAENKKTEKLAIPIFLLELTEKQKKELRKIGRKHKLNIFPYHFDKPKSSLARHIRDADMFVTDIDLSNGALTLDDDYSYHVDDFHDDYYL